MKEFQGSLSILKNVNILLYLMKGVAFTLIISIVAVLIGLVFGYILAIVRNYCRHGKYAILSRLASIYIEVFRNTPLLLWIFVCLVFVKTPSHFKFPLMGLSSVEIGLLFKGIVALTFFESSNIAEIVRGGLNAIPKGQFEAGYSQGFSSAAVMVHIILPQVYHKIVPTLLGQVITTIKDSSYIANIAVIELMARTRQVLSGAWQYNGLGQVNVTDVFVLFGFAFLVYFVIDFTLSMIVRRTQKKIA